MLRCSHCASAHHSPDSFTSTGLDTMTHIQEIIADESVDLIVLKDGRVLGIDGEFVVLYASLDEFYAATSQAKPTIEL